MITYTDGVPLLMGMVINFPQVMQLQPPLTSQYIVTHCEHTLYQLTYPITTHTLPLSHTR